MMSIAIFTYCRHEGASRLRDLAVVRIKIGMSQWRQESEYWTTGMDHVNKLSIGRIQPIFWIDDAGYGLEQRTRRIQSFPGKIIGLCS